MTTIVTGAGGLLGTEFAKHDTVPLTRQDFDITSVYDVWRMMHYYRPEYVINCAGIVPKAIPDVSCERVLQVNAHAPRYLAAMCDQYGSKLIQISTDCVFSGELGGYTENHFPNATDLYGMSKFFGEVDAPHLTIRTSFVGLEDTPGRGLLAWAIKQNYIVGYDAVFWNGLTTKELVNKTLELMSTQTGILHLHAPETVSKYELLMTAADVFGWKYTIVPESQLTNDFKESDKRLKSLFPTLQTKKTIREMLEELDAP